MTTKNCLHTEAFKLSLHLYLYPHPFYSTLCPNSANSISSLFQASYTTDLQHSSHNSILKNMWDIQWLYSEMVDQKVAPLTYSLFGTKSDKWPLSFCCHLEFFFGSLGATIIFDFKSSSTLSWSYNLMFNFGVTI